MEIYGKFVIIKKNEIRKRLILYVSFIKSDGMKYETYICV